METMKTKCTGMESKLADMLPDNVTVRLDSIGDFLSVLPAVEAEYDPDSFCA